jgi:predicted naringenin-chalcone synthase
VERLIAVFQLTPEQVAATWAVLHHFGNLSSATILFVLAELQQRLRQKGVGGERVEGVAMAFGPGLVIEMARLAYLPLLEAGNRNGTSVSQPEALQHVGLA